MKHTTYLLLAGLLVAGTLTLTGQAQEQTLGDYARAVRKEKPVGPAPKKFDNDNMPTTDKLSIVGNTPDAASAPAETANGAAPAADAPKVEEKDPNSTQERQKNIDQWKDKITAQKQQVDIATRELDVTQREYQLRAAAMYADAGNRLRNSAAWDKEDRQYKDQIAAKQKAVDAAKKALEDLQEQARKAGIPSSARQ